MGRYNISTRGVRGNFPIVLLFKLSDDVLHAVRTAYGRGCASSGLGIACVRSCIAALEVWRHCGITTLGVVFVVIFRDHRTLGISNIRLITCRQLMSLGPLH